LSTSVLGLSLVFVKVQRTVSPGETWMLALRLSVEPPLSASSLQSICDSR
jgi:hypothetical protein